MLYRSCGRQGLASHRAVIYVREALFAHTLNSDPIHTNVYSPRIPQDAVSRKPRTSVPARVMFWRFGRCGLLVVGAMREKVFLHFRRDTGVAAVLTQRRSDFQSQCAQQFGAPEVQNPNFVLRTLVHNSILRRLAVPNRCGA